MAFVNRGEVAPPATSAMDVLSCSGKQQLNSNEDACVFLHFPFGGNA
jgi:hypothetical protein